MGMGVASCLGLSTLYVASLYLWQTPASRQHPATVRARMVGVLATCSVAWLPCWHMSKQLTSQLSTSSSAGDTQPVPDLLQLLGLHLQGSALLEAVVRAMSLTAVLFLGPLHHKAMQRLQQNSKPGWSAWCEGVEKPRLHQVRDYLVAPIAEEWCFRACMVPLLWMEGFSWTALTFVTPLFFGLCHLHHAWGMAQQFGWTPRVAAMCLLQFAYTTLFGSYAVWLLTATGSTVAAVVVHSFCNMMGLPPFAHMRTSSLILCAVGLISFAALAPRFPRPGPTSGFWWQGRGGWGQGQLL